MSMASSDPKEVDRYHCRVAPFSMAEAGARNQILSAMADARGSCRGRTNGKKHAKKRGKMASSPAPWRVLRSLFSCKDHNDVHGESKCCRSSNKTIGCSEACNMSSRSLMAPGDYISTSFSSYSSASIVASATSSSFSSLGGSFRGVHLRRLSGCYQCHVTADPASAPSRDPSMRATLSPCPDCGEIFVRPESLELHQANRHAVSELGPEDTSRNIIEIIFQSSWLKNQAPVCKIERILKVHNTQNAIARFEDYRDSVKIKANKLTAKKQSNPRCIADGNELLRFHCTTFACSLGLNGSTALCHSTKHCGVCSIIRDGFKAADELGKIQTMATSGRAHDVAHCSKEAEKRAMLVCRVIAGRVRKSQQDAGEEFDSVVGPAAAGAYSCLDELFVFSPRAILPCFVVIYAGF